MRLTTLNLRGFVDWEARRPRIEAYLRGMAADVVLFQEVVHLPDVSPVSQVAILNRALGYPVRHESVTRLQAARDGSPFREGLALLSRLPIATTEALVLLREEGDPHQRLVQFADARDGETAWPLANVHLSIRDEFAVHHLEEVLGVLAARGERRIIAGDFNVNHLERHANLWRAGYLLTTEVERYVSYPGSGEANDYALVPKDIAIRHIEVSGDELSDHRALTVDLDPA